MSVCRSCGEKLPKDHRFCPACGTAVVADASDLTVSSESQPVVSGEGGRPDPAAHPPGAPETPGGTLVTGTILGGRYRIRGLLGRGGMGEVYRADDLQKSQPVALKFLHQELCTESMLDRFHNEVRMAGQVSHPNVCRVYDIQKMADRYFLSMEFIDGEDLQKLLRRIGRLPKDKALDITRQLCAGLAAAHEQGVLHRDLKPANIMIDGSGRVRITDFGLAGRATEFVGKEVRAGTPAYMSPEQVCGMEVTVQSDIYALGLVMYEMFTGRRAFKADSAAEVAELHRTANPIPPSQFIEAFDPVIERVLLSTLEKAPDCRPRSVRTIAAALAGEDRL